MDIPEEEIEQAIVWDLSLLQLRPYGKLKIVSRQKPLITKDGFIDLLLEDGKRYYIVELKRGYVKSKSVVLDQVLRYRNSLMNEYDLPADKFVCILANPQGFSDDVKEVCKFNRVKWKILDEDKILSVLANKTTQNFTYDKFGTIEKIIALRRKMKFKVLNEKEEHHSISEWIHNGYHDDLSKSRVAQLFKEISSKAPIQAHKVSDKMEYDYSLNTFEKCWFWMFYTVLDKRVHASLFVYAREILEKNDLFLPQDIIKFIEKYNEQYAIDKITEYLEKNNFPLVRDATLGKFASATAIVTAAKLISNYDYSFDKMYKHHLVSNNSDFASAKNSILDELSSIHGVGPRMVAQFVRGMVLKGNWDFKLDDDIFLEKGRFNEYFAGPARFCLIEKGDEYEEKLRNFADSYLDGNKGIGSHALWYIRKKYCGKAKHCSICPMAGFCNYYQKSNTVKLFVEGQESLLSWIPDPLEEDLQFSNKNS